MVPDGLLHKFGITQDERLVEIVLTVAELAARSGALNFSDPQIKRSEDIG